mgnify:CR=1 FL=1
MDEQKNRQPVELVRRKATKDKLNTAVSLWQNTQGHITKVCKALGVHRSTFYRWLERYPSFSQGLVDYIRKRPELDYLKHCLIARNI